MESGPHCSAGCGGPDHRGGTQARLTETQHEGKAKWWEKRGEGKEEGRQGDRGGLSAVFTLKIQDINET